MVSATDLPNIPNSHLKQNLIKKSNESHENRLDLLTQLNKFVNIVTDEIPFIWETFPEFTPHDDKHHLIPLFGIADKIIGLGYNNCNFSELFLLITGIFGHDWGMSVSKKFKQFTLNQSLSISNFDDNRDFLLKEREMFLKFIETEGLMIRKDKNYEKIPNSYWQKYVRDTHAIRSSYRVREYFSEINPNVADSIAKICLGHSLEFQDFEKPDFFPEKNSIFNETINLKAIALYLRIIDLLDICDSRASYTMYKFVSPKDKQSINHWKKIFAISSVSASKFSDGKRQILIRGSTDDPEVYAELEEYKNYCKSQIEKTAELFAQMNDPRHNFDIYYLNWKVETEGFNGVSIKFEFDRNEMFNILSSEVYQRDPFVFLRELLQNSIDAIRLKREFYKKMGDVPFFIGIVKVDIEYYDDNKVIIKWFDDGIGMDEYVIKHYLAVVGKSYYDKKNLENLGITLDPISKFGIGILSCFYVADSVKIETYKDPKIKADSTPLEILIPEVSKQFRVKGGSPDSIKQGTSITIFTNVAKFQKNIDKKELINGTFSNYITEIAGFVDFPIIITENNETTIIVHPNEKTSPDKKTKTLIKEYQNCSLKSIDYDYPFSSVFLPQDVDYAKTIFSVKKLDLKTDFHMKDFEGAIVFLTLPNHLEWKFEVSERNLGLQDIDGISIFDPKKPEIKMEVRWNNLRSVDEYFLPKSQLNKRLRHISYAIFKDGILLQNEKNPFEKFYRYSDKKLPLPFFNVNIQKTEINEINLARTKLFEGKHPWSIKIHNAITKYFIKNVFAPIINKNKKERWYNIGRILSIFPLDIDNLSSTISKDKIPIISLRKKGKIEFTNIGEIFSEKIYSIPLNMIEEFTELLSLSIVDGKKYEGFLNYWNGNACYGLERGYHSSYSYPSILKAFEFSGIMIQKEYFCSEIRFLHPACNNYPPLMQKIFRKSTQANLKLSISIILEKGSKHPEKLTPCELNLLNSSKEWKYDLQMPEIFSFQGSMSRYFAFGWEAINLNHPMSIKLIQIMAKKSIQTLTSTDQIIFGKISDKLIKMENLHYRHAKPEQSAKKIILEILKILLESDLITENEYQSLSSLDDLFIPFSFVIDTYKSEYFDTTKINPSFGILIP